MKYTFYIKYENTDILKKMKNTHITLYRNNSCIRFPVASGTNYHKLSGFIQCLLVVRGVKAIFTI